MIDLEKIDIKEIGLEDVAIENVTRRKFLQGVLASSAFVLCVGKSSLAASATGSGVSLATSGALASVGETAFHPNIFVGIHTDGMVYIVAHRSEMGNGVRTSLPRILAD